MADSAGAPVEESAYTREAIGAFAHELRTPLTSLRMLFELAKMQSPEGELDLTGDLPELLYSTVASIESLADELQEFSRVERGRTSFTLETGDLAAVLREAAARAAPAIVVSLEVDGSLRARFDPTRLLRAIGQLITAADYSGEGSGRVRIAARTVEGRAGVTIESGMRGGAVKPIAADMGFGFFAARRGITAMGADMKCERAEGFLAITVSFSLGTV